MDNASAEVMVNQKYQVIIPKALRNQYTIAPNQKVMLLADDQGIHISVKPKKFSAAMKGLGKDMWKKVGGVQALEKGRDTWE